MCDVTYAEVSTHYCDEVTQAPETKFASLLALEQNNRAGAVWPNYTKQ